MASRLENSNDWSHFENEACLQEELGAQVERVSYIESVWTIRGLARL